MVRVNIGTSPSTIPIPPSQIRAIASPIPTFDPTYWLPLRAKVTIMSNDGTITYFVYDSFLVDRGTFSGQTFTPQSFSFGNESYTYTSGTFSSSFTAGSFTQLQDPSVYRPITFTNPEGGIEVNP